MTGPRPAPPADDLPVAVLLTGGVLLSLLAVLVAAGWLTSGLATLLAGHGWQPLTGQDTLTLLLRWSQHPAAPQHAFPSRLRSLLPAPAVLWAVLLSVLSMLVATGTAAVLAAGRLVRAARTLHPGLLTGTGSGSPGRLRAGAPGLAGRAQIHRQLSARAVRARTGQTRPSLTGTRYPTRSVGLSLGRAVGTGQPVWGSVEDSYLLLGPPRSGKGIHLIIPYTLDAPGAVLVTSTRPDTLRATVDARRRRGPVLAFDPQQLSGQVEQLRWSPTRGCTDPLTAITRARALAAGAQLTSRSTTDGEFWTAMTAAVLRSYLHAAALTDRPVSDLLAWAAHPTDPTPVRILRQDSTAAPGWAEELATQAGADPRQRDSVWAGVRRAVDSLADPRVLAACNPTAGQQFQPEPFLRDQGCLYLLGSTGTQLSVAPLITALLEDLLDTARTLAATTPTGRLDPPLLLLLDEAANIAPIPTLPHLLADGGGAGITTVAVLQSLAQARARWGEAAADAMWDAATTKIILGGLAHAEDLSRISRLAGDIDRPIWTRSTSSSGPSRSVSTQRQPALPVEQLRCQPPGHALLLARHTPPVPVQLTPYWQQPPTAVTASRRSAARNQKEPSWTFR